MDGLTYLNVLANIPTLEQIADELVKQAMATVGIHEVGGNNRGPDVEIFQKTVDGKAQREAWCMAWLQTMVKRTCLVYGLTKNPLYPSEHCQTVWNHTPDRYRLKAPIRGSAFIRRNWGKQTGHTGLAKAGGKIWYPTVEGNTNKAGSSEGDAVMEKNRYVSTPTQETRGWINLPLMIQDALLAQKQPVTNG